VSVGVLAAGGESVFYLLVGARPLSTAGLRIAATGRRVRSWKDLAKRAVRSNANHVVPIGRTAARRCAADPVDRLVHGELA
jgi:hypothetical protein